MTLSGWHIGHTKIELVKALWRRMGWKHEYEPCVSEISISKDKLADLLAELGDPTKSRRPPLSEILFEACGRAKQIELNELSILDSVRATLAVNIRKCGLPANILEPSSLCGKLLALIDYAKSSESSVVNTGGEK